MMKPSQIPKRLALSSKQKRDMAANRADRAMKTWRVYVDRYEYIKKRYPKQVSDRNKAWLEWTKMMDEKERNQQHNMDEAQLWTFIDFARMSISRYANWIWWPERPDSIQTINKSKKSKSMGDSQGGGGDARHHDENDDSRTYISENQYYDHESNLIWTRKFAIVMDFNLFLFEQYANPSNIQETMNYEHLLLSLASTTKVKVCKANNSDFYLNTAGKKDQRFLQFRVHGKSDEDDVAQRNEWLEELDYQIHIVHDLLSIPGIKLKIADASATVWLPAPHLADHHPVHKTVSKPATPAHANMNDNNMSEQPPLSAKHHKKSSHKHSKTGQV